MAVGLTRKKACGHLWAQVRKDDRLLGHMGCAESLYPIGTSKDGLKTVDPSNTHYLHTCERRPWDIQSEMHETRPPLIQLK